MHIVALKLCAWEAFVAQWNDTKLMIAKTSVPEQRDKSEMNNKSCVLLLFICTFHQQTLYSILQHNTIRSSVHLLKNLKTLKPFVFRYDENKLHVSRVLWQRKLCFNSADCLRHLARRGPVRTEWYSRAANVLTADLVGSARKTSLRGTCGLSELLQNASSGSAMYSTVQRKMRYSVWTV